MKRIRRAALLALVFLIVFLGHVTSRNITSIDSAWSIHTAMSMIKEGNTDLDEYPQAQNDYRVEKVRGHVYTIFPIGVSLLAIPFVYVADKSLGPLLSSFPRLEKLIRRYSHQPLAVINVITIYPGIELLIASLIVALTTVFIYLLSSLFLNKKSSLFIAFIFAFCTSAWSTASRGLWQHGPSMLFLTIALYVVLLAKQKPWIIQFLGLPLVWAYVVRPTNSLSIVFFTVFIFLRYRKYFWRYILFSVFMALPFILYNFSIYHSWISPYYQPGRVGSTANLFEALVGTLMSPARGLFIFTPVLLFSFYGLFLKMKHRSFDPLDLCLLAIILSHWIIISSFPHWWAGWSFGPRFFSDMIPYLTYFLIPAVKSMYGAQRARKIILVSVFFCLIGISFFIHYRGATDRETYIWNREPVDVDDHKERLWDWHDIQFLRGIR